MNEHVLVALFCHVQPDRYCAAFHRSEFTRTKRAKTGSAGITTGYSQDVNIFTAWHRRALIPSRAAT
jgi:hypothetical protein